MTKETVGNLLRAEVAALVNAVNTEGVMARESRCSSQGPTRRCATDTAKRQRPAELSLGHVQVWPTGQMTGPKYIINFPTKGPPQGIAV